MTNKEISLILTILELTSKYGIPAVKEIMDSWGEDVEISPESVEELKNSIKPASDLF